MNLGISPDIVKAFRLILLIMVGVLGVEPRTSSLSGTRSNQLSYTPDIPLKMALPSLTELGSPFGNRHFLGAPLSVSPCGGLAAVLPTSSMVLFTDSTRDLKSNDFDQALLPFRSRQFHQARGAPTSATRNTETDVRSLVELTGIEPATYSLQSYRSSQLSYSPGRRSYPVFCIFSISFGSFDFLLFEL